MQHHVGRFLEEQRLLRLHRFHGVRVGDHRWHFDGRGLLRLQNPGGNPRHFFEQGFGAYYQAEGALGLRLGCGIKAGCLFQAIYRLLLLGKHLSESVARSDVLTGIIGEVVNPLAAVRYFLRREVAAVQQNRVVLGHLHIGEHRSAAEHVHQATFLILLLFGLVHHFVYRRVVAQVIHFVDQARVLSLGMDGGIQDWKLWHLLVPNAAHIILLRGDDTLVEFRLHHRVGAQVFFVVVIYFPDEVFVRSFRVERVPEVQFGLGRWRIGVGDVWHRLVKDTPPVRLVERSSIRIHYKLFIK